MAMTNAPTPHQNPGRKLRMFARLLIAGWYLHASNRAQGSFRTLTSFPWESISPEIVVKRKVSTGLNISLLCFACLLANYLGTKPSQAFLLIVAQYYGIPAKYFVNRSSGVRVDKLIFDQVSELYLRNY